MLEIVLKSANKEFEIGIKVQKGLLNKWNESERKNGAIDTRILSAFCGCYMISYLH